MISAGQNISNEVVGQISSNSERKRKDCPLSPITSHFLSQPAKRPTIELEVIFVINKYAKGIVCRAILFRHDDVTRKRVSNQLTKCGAQSLLLPLLKLFSTWNSIIKHIDIVHLLYH